MKTKIESGVYRYTATDGSEWIIKLGIYARGYGCVIWRTMVLTPLGWRWDFTGEGLQHCIDMIERVFFFFYKSWLVLLSIIKSPGFIDYLYFVVFKP